jgi:hypothetical protein
MYIHMYYGCIYIYIMLGGLGAELKGAGIKIYHACA